MQVARMRLVKNTWMNHNCTTIYPTMKIGNENTAKPGPAHWPITKIRCGSALFLHCRAFNDGSRGPPIWANRSRPKAWNQRLNLYQQDQTKIDQLHQHKNLLSLWTPAIVLQVAAEESLKAFAPF